MAKFKSNTLIEALIVDEIFRSSIEETFGKIKNLYPDYKAGKLIYEFENGDYKESSIARICERLTKIRYLSSISH